MVEPCYQQFGEVQKFIYAYDWLQKDSKLQKMLDDGIEGDNWEQPSEIEDLKKKEVTFLWVSGESIFIKSDYKKS